MSNDERQRLLADVDAFCEEVRPAEEICYLERRFNDQSISLARKYDLMGMAVERRYGGRGADVRTYAQAVSRIGREGSGLRTLFSVHSSIGQYPIDRFGTAEQKEQYLPASSRGEKIMAFALTEPDAGSNPLGPLTGDLFDFSIEVTP